MWNVAEKEVEKGVETVVDIFDGLFVCDSVKLAGKRGKVLVCWWCVCCLKE